MSSRDTEAGRVSLGLELNTRSMNSQIGSAANQVAAKMGNALKKIGVAFGAALSAKVLSDFGKKCVELGSDLAEVQNVVDVTFTSMSGQVDRFAKSAAKQFGLSETMAKRYTGTFGAMSKAFGFTEQQAYSMSTALTGLAGDVASFYNITQDEAYTKLKSVFTGETESLKDLGVVMTQTALDQFALSNGFGKTTKAMTEQEKVALRYAFVQKQLATASGDFARTSDGWANQVRILKLQFESLQATIGQGLINVLTPVLKIINTLIGRVASLAEHFRAFTEMLTGKKASGGGGGSGLGAAASAAADVTQNTEEASNAADTLSASTKKAGEAAKKAAKEAQGLMGFDQINKLSAPEESDSDSGAAAIPSGSSGVPAVSVPAVDYGTLADGTPAADRLTDSFVKRLKTLISPTVESIKKLWNGGMKKLGAFVKGTASDFAQDYLKPIGTWMLADNSGLPRLFNITNDLLNEIDWNRLRSSLDGFYSSLVQVTQFKWNVLMDFYEDFLKPLSVWTMSEAIPRIVDCFTSFNNSVDWNNLREKIDSVWKALEPFAEHIGEGLLWFIENVLTPLGAWIVNEVVPRFLETLADTITIFDNILVALQPLWQWFWDSVLLPIAEWAAGAFLSIWDGINGVLKTFGDWCKEHPGTIQNITIVIASFFAAFKIIKLVKDIGTLMGTMGTLLKGMTTVISTGFNPWVIALGLVIAAGVLLYKNWDTISAYAKKVWDFVKAKFNEFIQFVKGLFTKDWTTQFGIIGNVLNAFFKNAGNIIDGIKTAFKGVITFVKGVFSGDWKQAWEGVKQIFEGVWKTFAGIMKVPLNTVIGFINTFLGAVQSMVNGVASALNSITIDIPYWLQSLTGYSSIGFNLPYWTAPRIPYLAEGAYVRKNTPQLAVVGDNRKQGEIIAPEGKLLEMARLAASGAGGYDPRLYDLLLAILRLLQNARPVQIDPESLRKYFIQETNDRTKMNVGRSELLF